MSDRVLNEVKNSHNSCVWSVSWAGNRIYTGSADAANKVKCWEVDLGTVPVHVTPSTTKMNADASPLAAIAVSASSDGTALVVGTLDGSLMLLDTVSGTCKNLASEPSCAWGARFSPVDSTLFAVTGNTGNVRIFNTAKTTPERKLQSASHYCTSLAWSHDGLYIAVGGTDGTVTVFRTKNWSRMAAFPAHGRPVRAVAFAGAENELVVSGSDDSSIAVHSLVSQRQVAALTGHSGWVTALATTPKSPYLLVSGSTDRTIRTWDLTTNAPLLVITNHRKAVWGLAFDSTGTKVASVSDDSSLAIISVE